jgi:hypothetical protein
MDVQSLVRVSTVVPPSARPSQPAAVNGVVLVAKKLKDTSTGMDCADFPFKQTTGPAHCAMPYKASATAFYGMGPMLGTRAHRRCRTKGENIPISVTALGHQRDDHQIEKEFQCLEPFY